MVINTRYDVIIIGAGPAGMFAANELSGHGLKILVIDKGRDVEKRHCPMESVQHCMHCAPCNIMCGVGGAGTFSDGTLNLRPDIGGDLLEFTHDQEKAWELVDYVDNIFLQHGATEKVISPKGEDVEQLQRRAASVGAKFINIKQRHIGSDNAPAVIGKFKKKLDENGVDFLLNTDVKDLWIENNVCRGVFLNNGRTIEGSYTLLAPGRIGGKWVNEIVDKHSIDARYAGVDIGVRVEVPGIIMDPVTRINRDPKFHIQTRKYDDFVRTFCTNEHGFVVREEYEGFIATNGHSMHDTVSENTNFAFLVHIELTEPIENTIKYARSVAKLATTIGGGKPVLQRMGDLRRGRRSTEARLVRNPVVNTLKDVTPGDISMAMPHRIVMDIIEGLETLDRIIPGVACDSTLLYAPEVKFYSMKIQVDGNMQSNIRNLFAAGDGAGLSRDIVNASATGILAARGILEISAR
ncbi:NAD(P)/FAD-dependent oxidoreductase [Methanohalophilus mahii]|uniref:FAD-dependent pyridine nucleotide-disulfide oxidoreductase n=1 Tax=Methanohalophilus mahii (strain ATCC 35705 / DSM 5219 / SLP) TaxID=547558 RepID=D5E6Y5_METMS|nr:NAD(P)/FAD-dependent oxidoreductase [Methanohalophilus mahii]ADE36923.1 FAD-dependent pyridine nucleotide-disulfide oxidoreductase [Methanohalophilus mahii DSM 5219]